MSITLMSQAWKMKIPATAKIVLLALCDCANDQGECYPSVSALVTKCSLSDRAIQKQLADFERIGVLFREMRTGRSTVYHIRPNALMTPERGSPPNVVHPEPRSPTPERGSPPPPNVVHPTPERGAPRNINEPSIETSMNHHDNACAKKTTAKKRGSSTQTHADRMEILASYGVDEQTAQSWLQVRHAKGAKLILPNTMSDIEREASKAGLSLAEAVTACVSDGRQWAGFKASWYQNALLNNQAGQVKQQKKDNIPRDENGNVVYVPSRMRQRELRAEAEKNAINGMVTSSTIEKGQDNETRRPYGFYR